MRRPHLLRLLVIPAAFSLLAWNPTALLGQKTSDRKPPQKTQKNQPASKPDAKTAAAAAAKKPLDLRFISSRPLMAVVLHPQPLLTAPQFQAMPIEIFEAVAVQEAGIDISKIEEVVLLVTANLPQPPLPAWIVRFNEPCDQKAILQHLSTGETEQIADVQAHRAKGAEPLLLAFPDERTMLVASSDELAEMLKAKQPSSPLIDRLRAIDGGESLCAALVVEPIRPVLKASIAQLPPLPPDFQQFTQLADLLAAIEIHVQAGETMDSRLVLEGTSQGAAAKIDQLIDAAIALANAAVDARLTQLNTGDPSPVNEAATRYVKRMLKTAIDAVEREQTRNRLTLRVTGAGDASVSMATNGVLVALLLPAVQAARDAARRSQSNNNLKQIGLGLQTYADVNKTFPPRARFKDGKPLLSWRVMILPFVEQYPMYKQFHLDEPWDSEHNRQFIAKIPPCFVNPKLDPKLSQAGKTNYLAPTGPGTMFEGEKGANFATIRDGTSNTLIVVEANADRAVIWTKPDDLEIDPDKPLDGLGDFQPGGFMALFGDGHTSLIKKTIDPKMLLNLFNPRDGQTVNVD